MSESATDNQVARLKKLERKYATMKTDLMQQRNALTTQVQALTRALERIADGYPEAKQWSATKQLEDAFLEVEWARRVARAALTGEECEAE